MEGTLTQNTMTVSHSWYDGNTTSYDARKPRTPMDPTKKELFRIAALNNNARFDPESAAEPNLKKRKTLGDASESALLKFCERFYNVEEYRNKNPKIAEILFNSDNKWQLTIHKLEDGRKLLTMKGAPEKIISYCSTIMYNGTPEPLTEFWHKSFLDTYDYLGNLGERVLGFAQVYLPEDKYPDSFDWEHYMEELNRNPRKDLCFIGMISMIDPPREGVPDAVRKCISAGIRVIMVTGDHPLTAKAIVTLNV